MTKKKNNKMKKVKYILTALVLSSSLLLASTSSAMSDTQKTLVIIDTGVNTQIPEVRQAIVEEACFIEYGVCPNGQASMIGLGAATILPTQTKNRSFDHGTQMVSVALQVDQKVKIVFIRIVGMTTKGNPNSYTTRGLATALAWVEQNASRLNVGAVSASIGREYKETACPTESFLVEKITSLSKAGIPTFFSAGNSYGKPNYPACITEAITIGATDPSYYIKKELINAVANYSGTGDFVDFYAVGRFSAMKLDGSVARTAGASNSTSAVATYWVKTSSSYESLKSNALDAITSKRVIIPKSVVKVIP